MGTEEKRATRYANLPADPRLKIAGKLPVYRDDKEEPDGREEQSQTDPRYRHGMEM